MLTTWRRPILTPKTVLPLFFAIGIIFAPIGGLLLYASTQVRTYIWPYSDFRFTGADGVCCSLGQRDPSRLQSLLARCSGVRQRQWLRLYGKQERRLYVQVLKHLGRSTVGRPDRRQHHSQQRRPHQRQPMLSAIHHPREPKPAGPVLLPAHQLLPEPPSLCRFVRCHSALGNR